jgi:hypothetical protein
MKKFSVFLIIVIAGILIYSFWPEKELRHPPGVLAPDDPIQIPVTSPVSWQKGEFTITPLAEFKIKAFVLSTNSFSLGRESDLSPMDLALGWGQMSNQAIIDGLEISQSNRWYHWKAKVLVIPAKEIMTHSANMHIIPANDQIEETLDSLYKGCIIEMKGYLVSVRAEDGWHWKSSLRRDDTGGGACELVWAEELEIINE